MFFAATMPFRHFFRLTGVTEIRPAAAFPPVFGLLYGPAGAWGCALGNLLADICSGYSARLCVYGFAAQLLYGYIPFWMWYGLRSGNKERAGLHNVGQVLKYVGIIFVDAAFVAIALGMILQQLSLGSLWSQSTLILFLNDIVFCLVLGIPMLILAEMLQEKDFGRVMKLTVRFVLIFLMISVCSAVLMGWASYQELRDNIQDKLELWNRVYLMMFLDFFLICGLGMVFLHYLEKNIAVPIERLTEAARSYLSESGDGTCIRSDAKNQCISLSHVCGEPGEMASAFGQMMEDVERYVAEIAEVTAEKEHIRSELVLAARVQSDMLPDPSVALRETAGFLLDCKMTPAKEVGGDFYDFFMLDEKRLALVIADVSGKGVPAALFMVVARTLLRSHISSGAALHAAVAAANSDICENNRDGMFVTAWIGIVDLEVGTISYVNAGHNAPLLGKRGKIYDYLRERSGFVLAGDSNSKYREFTLQLRPDDVLFLYTDGVTEAHDIHKNLYGEARLLHKLRENAGCGPKELLERIWEDIVIFRGNADQFDDITMLAFMWKGKKESIPIQNTGPAKHERMEEISIFVEDSLAESDFTAMEKSRLLIAADEIFSNICAYSKAAEVTVSCRVCDGAAEFIFEDDGMEFNPLTCHKPDIESPLERREEGGLGIHMVRQMMDDVVYERIDGKNRMICRCNLRKNPLY